MTDPTALRDLCARYARAAGELALAGRRQAGHGLGRSTKSSPTDLVTEFDQAAERLIVDAIRADRPDDAIVGEEGTDQPGISGYAWHIDPIDGTTNFVYDLPAWSCSVGVTYDGATVAGAVYVPPLDELFTAAAGAGADLNGTAIRVNPISDTSVALVATGFAYQPTTRTAQAELVAELIGHVRDIRRLGSAAIDLCHVACGRVDAYYELGLNSWDITAGELIAREAGASTSDWSGAAPTPQRLLAAAPGIHAALLRLLEHAAPTPA